MTNLQMLLRHKTMGPWVLRLAKIFEAEIFSTTTMAFL